MFSRGFNIGGQKCPPGKIFEIWKKIIFSLMDSLQKKNTPRSSRAKGILSSAIFRYRASKDVEGG